jgi:hypothetical protein
LPSARIPTPSSSDARSRARRPDSDATARRIDEAISAIVQEQYARAEKLIADNAEAHRKIAEALLQHETLDGVHVMEILKTGAIQTPIAPPATAPAQRGAGRRLPPLRRPTPAPASSLRLPPLEVCPRRTGGVG